MKKSDLHTISIFVANKPGVLVRVALVFARRGYNIDSLVVSPGKTDKYSRMTITAQGDPITLDQIIKQCHKLVDVLHAEEHDPTDSIALEYALVKVKSSTSVKNLIAKQGRKYHAKIVDDTDKTLIVQQAGTTEVLDDFETLLKKHGVIEVVRSGKLVMATGKEHT